MKRLIALLAMIAAFGFAGHTTALQNTEDEWFEDGLYDDRYDADDGGADDGWFHGDEEDDLTGEEAYDAEDDYGMYDSDYDWETDEDWFEQWYGDADDNWDWF